MGLNGEMTQRMGVKMSHFGQESNGKFALKTDVVFVGIFIVFMFLTAMLNNQVIWKHVTQG